MGQTKETISGNREFLTEMYEWSKVKKLRKKNKK